MSKSKVFSQLRSGYTTTPNALINDDRIDKAARFLYVLINCQAESFTFKQSWLLRMLGIKDPKTLAKYVEELQEAGWAFRLRRRMASGRLGPYDYYLLAAANPDYVSEVFTSGGFFQGGIFPVWPPSSMEKTQGLNNKEGSNNKNKTNKTKGSFVAPSRQELGKFIYNFLITDKDLKKPGVVNGPKYWAVWIADDMIEHYSPGWKLSNGRQMKDWEKSARRWVRSMSHRLKYPSTNNPDHVNGSSKDEAPAAVAAPNFKKVDSGEAYDLSILTNQLTQ
jgi:hypothetical protein